MQFHETHIICCCIDGLDVEADIASLGDGSGDADEGPILLEKGPDISDGNEV